MNRRAFLTATGAFALAPVLPASAQTPPVRTQWHVRGSEGFDALAFLGALTEDPMFMKYHGDAVTSFAPRLPALIRAEIKTLWAEAAVSPFGLLGPNLAVLVSNGNDRTIEDVIAAVAQPATRIHPGYRASVYWNAGEWAWFIAAAPRIHRILSAVRDAGFANFVRERLGPNAAAGRQGLADALRPFDVIRWQEKLTGRTFDPTIEVVTLCFGQPFGSKVQGQTFLQDVRNTVSNTVRVAAHEMLHPPMPMNGPAARAALDILSRDPLMIKIVRDHDPKWGYTTLKAY